MNNILLYLGGLLVVVLAALFGLPYAIDWNGYRGVFEEEASRVLGREVRVAGNVGLRLLPSPYLHAEKLRIGGAIGEEAGRPLFRAEGFTIWVSVPPLLKGVMEAREIELDRPEIELSMDAEGRTSLSSLQMTPGTISFVPQDISLQSVRVIDGSLGLTGPNGMELARVTALNGEFSADTLDGPYRFRGKLAWEGDPREVRLTTARLDPNGDLRFKALVSVPATGNSYTLDATAGGLSEAPRVDGKLTARISTEGFEVAPVPQAAEAAPGGAGGEKSAAPAGFFELTSTVKSEPGRISLDDISISLEQGGLPQLISGRSFIGWGDQLLLDVDLSSKWLDLDQLTAGVSAASDAIPLELARTLFDRLVDQLPATADTNIALAIDQLGLGKQAVSGFRLSASRSGGPLELKDVRASLPGGTSLALDGVLDGEAGSRSFSGTMALSGQSLTRFANWGFGDNPFSRRRSDGPFSIAGTLTLSDSAIELAEATADLTGTPILGEIKLGLDAPRRLAVALEGHSINLADLWPDNPGLSGVRALLTEGAVGAQASSQGDPEAEEDGFFASDVSLDIKADELIEGARKLQNVHLDVTLQKGRLSVPRMKFTSAGGLAVDLAGSAVDVPRKTRGSLRGVLEAPTPEAVNTLSELLDLPEDIESKVARWSRLAPWQLATTVSFGERKPEAVDISLDGLLRGGRAVADVKIDAARGEWKSAPADITASIETPDVYAFLDMIAEVKSAGAEPGRPGKLFVKAAGKAADGLVAVAELDADTVQLDFNGRVIVPENDNVAAKGEVRIDAQDLRRVLALTGLAVAPGLGSVSLNGKLAAAHDGTKLTLASPALSIGDSAVSGVLSYRPGAEGQPAMVEAELAADKASLPTLLASVTAAPAMIGEGEIALPSSAPPPSRRRKDEPEASQVSSPRAIWPAQAFDLTPLDHISGTVKASVRSLALEPGLAMKDARLNLVLAPGRLEVKSLEGAALGGKAVSGFVIQQQAAGVSLDGDLKISISSKGSSESGQDDAIEGDVASLAVDFAGNALSPHAMMGAVTGKGELALGDVTLSGVAPQAVSEVSEEALLAKGPSSGEPLVTALRTALKDTEMKIGQVKVPVEISDGAMKLSRVKIETADGRATFDAALDLQTFTLNSGWKIEGKGIARAAPSVAGAAAPAEKGAAPPGEIKRSLLPAISLVYSGPIAELGAMEPDISVDALERELTVRRMERDVDELERLRKLDEQRAKKERERQKALEAERARQLEEQQRQQEQQTLPGDPASGPGEAAVPEGTAGPDGITGDDADLASEDAQKPAKRSQRVQTQIKKKPPTNSWQPFQISPYQ